MEAECGECAVTEIEKTETGHDDRETRIEMRWVVAACVSSAMAADGRAGVCTADVAGSWPSQNYQQKPKRKELYFLFYLLLVWATLF